MNELPSNAVDRLFARLHGIYGAKFLSQFSRIENGEDAGLKMAKKVWAEELGCFSGDKLELIKYGIENLGGEFDKFPPTVFEFKKLCARGGASRKEFEPLPEAKPMTEEQRRSLRESVGGIGRNRSHTEWVKNIAGRIGCKTNPPTGIAVAMARDAAKRLGVKIEALGA